MSPNRSVLWAAIAVVPAALVQIAPIDDFDVWWLLKAGEYMVTTVSFPRVDPFSWTAEGLPWLNHSWGFELILYAAYVLAGLNGLIALQALCALATFLVMYWTLRRAALPVLWTVTLIWLAAVLTRGFWSPRPQIVTYLCLAILWAVVRDYREEVADRLRWLPVLMAVWVNLHGGFFIGLAVLALATVGLGADRLFPLREDTCGAPRVAPMAVALAASVGAAVVNPFHVQALVFPLEVMADQSAKDLIIEWFSPAFQYPQLRPFEGVLLLSLVALPAARVVRLGDLLLLLAFVHLALDATRNIPLLVIVLMPLWGRLGTAVWTQVRTAAAVVGPPARSRVVVAVGVALLLPLGLFRDIGSLRPPSLLPGFGLASVFPTGAADHLLAHPLPGPMFNDYGWGGYLTWRLYPRYRVFMDGRVALYPPEVREDFVSIHNGHGGWRDALDRRGIRLVLIRRGTVLAGLLREAPEWSLAYGDRLALVFQRRPEPAT